MNTKICLISPKFLGHIGGMETHAYEFVKWFKNYGSYQIASIITKKKVTDGIPVFRNKKDKLNIPIIKGLTGNFKEDLNLILENSPIDTNIYFFNSPNWIPIIKSLKEYRKGSKIIIRSGGTDLIAGWIGNENDTSKNMLKNRILMVNAINNYADTLIVNSNFSKKRFLNIGIKESKIVTISGGVDCERYNPLLRKRNDNKIIVLHASRFVKCKGIDNTIEAFKMAINKTKIKTNLVIIGDGPEKHYLMELVKTLGINNSVFFAGAKIVEDMHSYFNNADIFVHLPITLTKKERGGKFEHVESMGRVFCEAAAAGLPSIAFAVGGVPEIIKNKETGFLIKEGNIIKAADKLILLLKNKKNRLAMGKKARKRALKYFDWKVIFKKYNELFLK